MAWILKICSLPSRSGRPNSIFLSNRPGRNKAGSSVSGLSERRSNQVYQRSQTDDRNGARDAPVGGHQHLDSASRVESVELDDQFYSATECSCSNELPDHEVDRIMKAIRTHLTLSAGPRCHPPHRRRIELLLRRQSHYEPEKRRRQPRPLGLLGRHGKCGLTRRRGYKTCAAEPVPTKPSPGFNTRSSRPQL